MICKHDRFHAVVEVARIIDMGRFCADIRINCRDCGEPFHFIGVPCGSSPEYPMTSVDGLELRAPMRSGIAAALGKLQ